MPSQPKSSRTIQTARNNTSSSAAQIPSARRYAASEMCICDSTREAAEGKTVENTSSAMTGSERVSIFSMYFGMILSFQYGENNLNRVKTAYAFAESKKHTNTILYYSTTLLKFLRFFELF